jgi:hypothetical protein
MRDPVGDYVSYKLAVLGEKDDVPRPQFTDIVPLISPAKAMIVGSP